MGPMPATQHWFSGMALFLAGSFAFDCALVATGAIVPTLRPSLRMSAAAQLINNLAAYLFEAEFVSAGFARVLNPFPAISI